MSIYVLSPEEWLLESKKTFGKLNPGSLFSLYSYPAHRWFVAAKKISDQEWEVIELNENNIKAIMAGSACKISQLSFDEMFQQCIQLRTEYI